MKGDSFVIPFYRDITIKYIGNKTFLHTKISTLQAAVNISDLNVALSNFL